MSYVYLLNVQNNRIQTEKREFVLLIEYPVRLFLPSLTPFVSKKCLSLERNAVEKQET